MGTRISVPFTLNCGLAVEPWFFDKPMALVVAFLRRLGHQVLVYLDDFFGAAKPRRAITLTGKEDTQELGRLISLLFAKLWL